MKNSSVLVMSVLASACMVAVASQSLDGVHWISPAEESEAPVVGDVAVDETPGRWFVELSGAPASDGGNPADLKAEKHAFRQGVRAAKVRLIENYAYDSLFNGLSVTVSRSQLSTLARMPGVKAIYPVDTYAMPEPVESAEPAMATALAQTGADLAQRDLGLDGRGIKVAIIDSGIDLDHPDLGGSGTPGTTAFPSQRIVAGYDFVGDAFGTTSGEPAPDANPDDCGGHGTHVAGIVGASGTVTGVAPDVSFGAYRVFGCGGSTSADIIVAAMERAYADGMDVVNMSLGAAFQWPQYPTAKAASRMVNKGMVVIASAGNSGTSGVYSLGAPSVGDKVISVASFDNTHVRQRFFTVSPDAAPVGFNGASGSPAAPASGSVPFARTGTAASTADACAALPAGSLTGKVALVRRGACSFHTKALNAQTAGASGVVIYDNALGAPLSPSVAGTPSIAVPVVGITASAGQMLDSRIAAGATTLTWTSSIGSFPTPVGGLLSSFSSYGMSPDLQLKPDVGAPGGSIYSTYPLESGGFATLSGTSMSSPHVAGAVALLLQAAPRTPSQAVNRILQNSAAPQKWAGNPGLNFLDVVHRQGAGMVQIVDAITAATRVEPGKLSLGESEAGPVTRTITLQNGGSTAVTYALSAVNALSTGPSTFVPAFASSNASVSFAAGSVMLQPGQTLPVEVTITPPTGPNGGIYGGYLVLAPNDGSPVLRVPFAGYVGDYQARQVLTPTPNGFPWLARLNAAGTSYSRVAADGGAYTMAGNDVPYFLIHFDHNAALMRMEVVDADSGKSWHQALELKHLARNSGPTGFFAYSWDGTTTAGKKTYTVPNGRYVVKVSVLKALGDASNPAHWESWESPVVTVAR